jgi:hypothetical protein
MSTHKHAVLTTRAKAVAARRKLNKNFTMGIGQPKHNGKGKSEAMLCKRATA